MGASFEIVSLSGERILQAFPLIQAAWPAIDLAAWKSFIRSFRAESTAGQSDVVALRNSAGYLSGVLAYRRDWDLRAGPILTAQLFLAIDLLNSLRTIGALLEAVETRASELGCAGVQVRVCNEQARLASCLNTLGLSREASVFSRNREAANKLN